MLVSPRSPALYGFRGNHAEAGQPACGNFLAEVPAHFMDLVAGMVDGFAQLLDAHIENAAPVRHIHLLRQVDALGHGGVGSIVHAMLLAGELLVSLVLIGDQARKFRDSSCSRDGSTGLVQWSSKPASAARRLSSCWPQPVNAISRGCRMPGTLAQLPRDVVAVHVRQPDVQQHHIGLELRRAGQRAGAVVRDQDLVAHHPQEFGERVGGVPVVVHHQHAPRRRRPTARSRRSRAGCAGGTAPFGCGAGTR